MPVVTLVVGPLETNCYVVWQDPGPGALVIDAGGDPEAIGEALRSRGLLPGALFSTHGHVDHVAANAALKARFPEMKLALMREERKLLFRPAHNLSLFLGGAIRPPEPDLYLAEGDELEVGGMRFRVIHLPGHTPGGGALVGDVDGRGVVFSGDALFAGSVGRTDFPGGSIETLLASVRKLFRLPDDTVVYPGHGPATTVGAEKAGNPFVR